MSETKQCTKCHVFKLIDQFAKKNGSYLKSCNTCREKNNRKNRERYHNNGGKERWRATRKAYDIAHREQKRESSVRYYNSHKEIEAARHLKYVNENPHIPRLISIVSHSKRSDVRYNRLDLNHFIDRIFVEQLMVEQKMKCIYCDVDMKLDCDKLASELMSIERVDNEIGHTKANCVLACYKCNLTRQDKYTFEEFMNIKRNPVND